MRWLLIISTLALMASCKPQVIIQREVRDSIIMREVVRYDTVTIPADTVRVGFRIECDSLTNRPKPVHVTTRTGRAQATITIDHTGVLMVKALCDSLQKVIEIKDKELQRFKSSNQVEYRTEYKTRWYDKVARWMALILIVIIAWQFRHVILNRL